MQVRARGRALGTLGQGAAAVLDVECLRVLTQRAHYRVPPPSPLCPVRDIPSAPACAMLRATTAPGVCIPRARAPRRRAAQVAPDPLRVDLPARQVHVRVGDQPALVRPQRHPLGEHVVGVRQPRAPVRSRVVGERDAVLAQQRPRPRHVGDDRLVRVDQVGVRARPERPHTRRNPRSRYIAHSRSFTHERSSARARCSARRSRPGS